MHIIIVYLKTVVFEQKGAGRLERKPDFRDALLDKVQLLNTCWEMRA